MLTLQHFILRPKVLALYRLAIRSSRSIEPPAARKETLYWIRKEFERNRDVQDADQIKALLKSGRRDMRNYLPTLYLGPNSNKPVDDP